MRRILFLLMLMCSVSTWAQDVIVKRDGTAVICRIINVSSLEIVYKKWTDLQGPNLVMSIADAASITYENGEKKTFDTPATNVLTPTVLTPMGQQTVSDDALLKMVVENNTPKKVKKIKIAGYVGGSALIVTGVMLFGASCQGEGGFFGLDAMQAGLFVPGIAAFVGGITWITASQIKANKIKRQSVFNVQTIPLYQHDICFKNGSSLVANLDMIKDNTRHNPTLGVGLTYNF